MKHNVGLLYKGFCEKVHRDSEYAWYIDNVKFPYLREDVHPPESNHSLIRKDSDVMEYEDSEYKFNNVTALYNDNFTWSTYNSYMCEYMDDNRNFVLTYKSHIKDSISSDGLLDWNTKIELPIDYNIYLYNTSSIKVQSFVEQKHNCTDGRIVPNYKQELEVIDDYYTYILARLDSMYYQSLQKDGEIVCNQMRKIIGRDIYVPYLTIYSKDKYFGEFSMYTEFDYEVLEKSRQLKLELPKKST